MPPLTRQLIATIKSMVQGYAHVLKWNRNQPRGPKGSATGGQWISQGSHGTGAASAIDDKYGTAPGMERYATHGDRGAGFSTMDRARAIAGHTRTPDPSFKPVLLNVKEGGRGFVNRPRGVGVPEPPPPDPHQEVIQALKTDRATDSRPLGNAGNANASCVVTLVDDKGETIEAVYKPERGESWSLRFANHDIKKMVTNKDFSLAARETFAYEVDSALKLEIVPETVLREVVDETNIDINTKAKGGMNSGDGQGYDSDQAREDYRDYQENAEEDARENAYEEAGDQMADLYHEAQKEHVSDIQERAKEVQEIWDEEYEAFRDQDAHGTRSAMLEHPTLPMGSKEPFERKPDEGKLNPIEFLDEANVDVTDSMNEAEENKVRELIRAKLKDGYSGFDEVDEDDAEEHLDRDKFIEDHADTEARIIDSIVAKNVQSYTEWRHDHGYNTSGTAPSGSGSGSGPDMNPDAPHPQGGSFQHYRSDARKDGYLSASGGAKLAVLDYMIGTMDRHPNNLMYDGTEPVAIDNGYSMPAVPDGDPPDAFTFRSHGARDWASSGTIPDATRTEILDSMSKTNWQAVMDRHPNMNALERKAFLGRVEKMKTALGTPDGLKNLWSGLNNMW